MTILTQEIKLLGGIFSYVAIGRLHTSFLFRHTYTIHRQTSCRRNKDICKHA